MAIESKIATLVNQLTRATVERKIEWKEVAPDPGLLDSAINSIDFYCHAWYKDQLLALFERRVLRHDPDRDIDVLVSAPVLAIRTSSHTFWESTEWVPGLQVLLKLAKEQSLSVDQLLDQLIA